MKQKNKKREDDELSEVELWKAYKEHNMRDRQRMREVATNQFEEARKAAKGAGLQLKRHSESHYQLTDGQWISNIYPGNRRLWSDKNAEVRAPFLSDLPPNWTLLTVVRCFVEEINKQQRIMNF